MSGRQPGRFRRWLQGRPRLLEWAYDLTHRLFEKAHPLIRKIGYPRAEAWIIPFEEPAKRLAFDCRMCGQCILHSTGMTCPMTCPKNMRNGPCGGVRPNGHCEVFPEMPCIWAEAFERSLRMPVYGEEIQWIQPPVDHRLWGDSAWINMLVGTDRAVPLGWVSPPAPPLPQQQALVAAAGPENDGHRS
jgi:hypothetical protein